MRTTADVVTALWKFMQNGPTVSQLQGDLYKFARPAGVVKESGVINALPINNELLQECIVNINLFVPNDTVNVDGIQDTSLPNTARLQQLASVLAQEVNDIWISDLQIGFTIQQQMQIQNDQEDEWYINTRLRAYNINV